MADNIFDLMRSVSLTSGITFLIVTHDPRLAKRCDRIIELVDGRIDSDKPNAATHSEPRVKKQALHLHETGALPYRHALQQAQPSTFKQDRHEKL